MNISVWIFLSPLLLTLSQAALPIPACQPVNVHIALGNEYSNALSGKIAATNSSAVIIFQTAERCPEAYISLTEVTT